MWCTNAQYATKLYIFYCNNYNVQDFKYVQSVWKVQAYIKHIEYLLLCQLLALITSPARKNGALHFILSQMPSEMQDFYTLVASP